MFKVMCPVCKIKMPDKVPASLGETYECPHCNAVLKVSASYKVSYFLMLFLGSYFGITLKDLLRLKDTGIQKFVTGPLIIGLSVGLALFLLTLLYPKKLTEIK